MYSLYLHIPFCSHRCAYCDFNTYAHQEDSIPAYVQALMREIHFVGERTPPDAIVHTVFVGGGTPSLLSGPQFDSILRALRAAFKFSSAPEISIEANPGTTSREKLDALRRAGVNRISFGVQSANTEELRMLEREHDFIDVIEAVSDARKAGFDNLNLDIIYGLPEQALSTWQTTVGRIVDLHPEHISAYALALEHGTPFGRWANKGLLPLPNPDLAADMYEWACDFLAQENYQQYEISNWAKPEKQCRHNVQYWRSKPYIAFGAGAHGYVNGMRYSNVLRIKTYIERLSGFSADKYQFPHSPAVVNAREQTMREEMSDYMLNNLRLTETGVSGSDFRSRFGRGVAEVYPEEITELIRDGLLEKKTSDDLEVFRLTKRGRLLGNQVFMRFVDG